MSTITNYSRFYALLNRMEGDKEEQKALLVSQYTNGRTESLKEMRPTEYRAMCNGLQRTLDNKPQYTESQLRRKRSECLHLMQELGVDTTDWKVVDLYVKDPRISGKAFYVHTYEDLDRLAKKLRAIKMKADNAPKKEPAKTRGRKALVLKVELSHALSCQK